jgi:flagellar protein FliO/FliZ
LQKRTFISKVALLLLLALLGPQNWAYAEQVNNSVKDWIENPDRKEEHSVQNNHEANKTESGESIGLDIWDFFRMIFATIFVLALLYIMLKIVNKKSMVYKSTQLVENLGGTSLGGNRSIQMVKVGNRILVVGVGENIQLLKDIDDPDEFRQIISQYNDKMEQLMQPSDIVTKVMRGIRKTGAAAKEEDSSFSMLFKKQLDELREERKMMIERMEQRRKDEQ